MALTLFTVALSVALLLGVDNLRTQAKQSFASTVSGTDLIVGARTGQIQLLLYSVFHIGNATNNISYDSYQRIAANRIVEWTIPLSLGDSHRGYRVVGTTNAFFEHYQYGEQQALRFAQGKPLDGVFDVVVGAEVARQLGYSLGDRLVVAHGLGQVSFHPHEHHPFVLSGILAPTGTPVDRSVLVSLAAIEAIHLPPSAEGYAAEQLTPKTITAFMVGMKSRMQVFSAQRVINQYRGEPLLAILPGVALQELWGMSRMLESALLAIAAAVVVTGFISMLVALLAGLKERRREMAILRSIGARPWQIFTLMMWESTLLSMLGSVLGMLLMYLLLWGLQPLLLSRFGFYLTLGWPTLTQLGLLGCIVAGGALLGVLPAWRAYRNSLSDGMQIRF